MEAGDTSMAGLLQELARLRQRMATLEAATDRSQQAEDVLRTSAMSFRTLVEGSLQGILVHRDHQPLFVNQAFASMLGYATPADILQMETVLPLIAPQDRGRLGAYCAARLRGEAVPPQYEYRALHRNGTQLWVEVRVTMIDWANAPAMLLTTVDITARKRVEEVLARYHLLAEQTRDIILFIRRDGRIIEANQAAITAYGYDRQTLLTLTIADLRDPATLPLVAPQMAEADQSGILFETVHRRQDGSSFPVEVSSSGATIGDDRVLLSIIRDITDRKQAEVALQQSETRFRLAARATNDVIWDWDLCTDTVAWSEAIATLFGYEEAVTGTDASWWKCRIHPDERQRVMRSIEAAINSGQVHWAAEYRFQHADASYAEVLNRGFVVHNAHGVPIRMIGAMLDLTERKRGEQALRRERELLQKIVDTIPVMIAMYRPDIQVLQLNREFERVTGYSTEEARRVDLMAQCYPDPAYREIVRAYMESLQPGWWDIQMMTKDRRVIESSWANIRLSDDTHIGVGIDITARKQAEQALQQAHAELEQRVQERTAALQHEMAERQRLAREAQRAEHFALLGRLAAGVSHEIRNPLGAVFLHVDLLEEEIRQPSPDSPMQITQSFAEIKTHLARLEDLVQDYLSLVRVANIKRTVQELGATVQTWAGEFRKQAVAQGVSLHLLGMQELGQIAFHDSTLHRALLNLVQNAFDAMPQGGALTLEGQGDTTHVYLHVRDTGSGIAPEHLSRIFEPLHTSKPGGTGLGLYIVQEIVAAHGGQVTVESVVGQGTTFTLMLPRAAVVAAPLEDTVTVVQRPCD